MLDSVDVPVEHLLVIDNGEGSDLYFSEKFKNVTVLDMPANLGVAGSWNLGIKSFPHAERWLIASNDVQFGNGALEELSKARREDITLTEKFPYWQAFVLGDRAVSKIGLFDEALHPAYFEDNDYERRAEYAGITIKKMKLDITHENSSTVRSGYEHRNALTYQNNNKYYEAKKANQDYSSGSWSLEIRRENSWD
jgi:GT2 family glycosyltransferase